ncbi:MAG: hypothetical protein JNL75_03995 [Chitinophagales bacterium]|nr:hypothetical protein [Chitinophagales bacterium]
MGYNVFNLIQYLFLSYYSLTTPSDGYENMTFFNKVKFLTEQHIAALTLITYVSQAWMAINILFLLFEKNRRTLADYFAGTIVGRKVEDDIDAIGREFE